MAGDKHSHTGTKGVSFNNVSIYARLLKLRTLSTLVGNDESAMKQSAAIHCIAWRDCPKRGSSASQSVGSAVVSDENGASEGISASREAPFRAPSGLFGRSRKVNSPKFSSMSGGCPDPPSYR